MNHWLLPHERPLVIGHRGASAHAPENTLAAFRLAREQGADGIELDAKRCASGEVVIMHDPELRRTTGAAGKVHEWTLADLRTLDAGRGERVPTLDEVFEGAGSGLLVNVEVTNYSTPDDGLEAAVIDVVRRHGIADRVVFSSFNPLSLRQLAALAADIPRAFLFSPESPLDLQQVFADPLMPHQFRHPHYSLVTAEMVELWRASGILVNAWTANARADIRRMVACGVNGIIGDSPRTIREALQIRD
ncbi:MAG: glycerophosphodiester phosphodiesterase [Chloroflexi bacterium]|nr:glycerophosphodiester phosphodiesterase [Chloroflexota bacterium]MCL5275971.1 glycerophosphodiester phosphodiesterase [Chloroflexota bacterium]